MRTLLTIFFDENCISKFKELSGIKYILSQNEGVFEENRNFRFTKRIKYVKNELGEFKEMYFEVQFLNIIDCHNSWYNFLRFFFPIKPKYISFTTWVTEHAFSFKYETIEEVYTCQGDKHDQRT